MWLTVGFSVPLVNILHDFPAEQLLFIRGFVTIIVLLPWLLRERLAVSRKNVLLALSFGLASIGLFAGTRIWGPNPTIIVFSASPILNVLFARWRGRRIGIPPIAAFITLFLGIIVMLQPWAVQGEFHLSGLLWSLFGMTMNAVFQEILGQSSNASPLSRSLWQSFGCIAVGGLSILWVPWLWAIAEGHQVWSLIGFGLLSGVLNLRSNTLAFDHLPTAVASILAAGAAPATIIISNWLLHTTLSVAQWGGVALAMASVAYLSAWLGKKSFGTKGVAVQD